MSAASKKQKVKSGNGTGGSSAQFPLCALYCGTCLSNDVGRSPSQAARGPMAESLRRLDGGRAGRFISPQIGLFTGALPCRLARANRHDWGRWKAVEFALTASADHSMFPRRTGVSLALRRGTVTSSPGQCGAGPCAHLRYVVVTRSSPPAGSGCTAGAAGKASPVRGSTNSIKSVVALLRSAYSPRRAGSATARAS